MPQPGDRFIVLNIVNALVGFLAVAIALPAMGGNGRILQTLQGASGPGYKPCPDTTGVVGPRHLVDFEDAWFILHGKATGQAVMRMTMSTSWSSDFE